MKEKHKTYFSLQTTDLRVKMDGHALRSENILVILSYISCKNSNLSGPWCSCWTVDFCLSDSYKKAITCPINVLCGEKIWKRCTRFECLKWRWTCLQICFCLFFLSQTLRSLKHNHMWSLPFLLKSLWILKTHIHVSDNINSLNMIKNVLITARLKWWEKIQLFPYDSLNLSIR